MVYVWPAAGSQSGVIFALFHRRRPVPTLKIGSSSQLMVICAHLFQALCGTNVEIPTLTANEKIPLDLSDEILKPSTVKRIIGKGLPRPKEPTKRGDILVTFDIQFPDKLSSSTKDFLHRNLPNK